MSVVAAQSAGHVVAVGRAQMRFAPALAVKRFNANMAYPARTVSDLEVENAGIDDDEDAMLNVNGQEDFVNMKVRRIAQLMRGKHPPYVRFG
ncbi:hypothetical protein AAVH_20654 [Aphelenchoides avenae]|nr:hypothetical protein AAVH_20654 [Aphelenchus avenae]